MNVKVNKPDKNTVLLEIEVPFEKFEEGMEASYKKTANRYTVPGFRKGKVPRRILERYYGESIFYEDAVDLICSQTYEVALEENNIDPVDKPEIDIKQIGNGQTLIYSAKVVVKPEVILGEYKGVEVKNVLGDVTDEDVQREIEVLQQKNAREVEVFGEEAQKGFTVNINFEGFVDGNAFEGGKASNHDLVIGSGQFIPGFEEQIIGKRVDEEFEVSVKFPDEYHSSDLAGKDSKFIVSINSMRKKELPELDDEFAKDVSEFETLDDYKSSIRSSLVAKKEEENKRAIESNVLEKIVSNSDFEVPEAMIKNRIESIVYEFEYNLRAQGLSLKKYLEILGINLEQFKIKFTDRARKEVSNSLVLEKISIVEQIKATDEQVEEEIQFAAKENKIDIKEYKRSLTEPDLERIRYNVIVKNTLDMLVTSAILV